MTEASCGVVAPVARDEGLLLLGSARFTHSIQDMIAVASQIGGGVIAPIWRKPGQTAPGMPTLLRNAHLAKLMTPAPMLNLKASENLIGANFSYEELL